MAIVINGSGTITGVSAGGLPDASVVTADIANDAITLLKMEGGTDGQIITYDASGDPVRVGPGTDGQVLTSTGAGSPPAFEAAAASGSNGWKFISETVASNDATVNITAGITSTYDKYMISITNLDPVDDDEEFRMKFSADGGSSYRESGNDYRWSISSYGVGSARDDHLSTTTAYINILAGTGSNESVGNASTRCSDVIIMLSAPASTVNKPMITWTGGMHATGNEPLTLQGMGFYTAGLEIINAVEFYFEAGNVNTGNFALYGLVNV